MSEQKKLTVTAIAEDGTEKIFTVEFEIFETTTLDDRNFRKKSIFPNVVLIEDKRIGLSDKKFIDPRDEKEYTLKGNF
ncbi:TPA: hypothetical protein JI084_15725 [Acinetobacter baumannii]|uniref:hypothetical protein n=1 Tax=Acinetobacter junii TaxID=40215 RepID=UPI00297BA0E2|nr:hypothetical protein [Acinetobacter baumannii]